MQEFLKSILRLVQFLLVLLTTALMGNVVATNGGNVANNALNYIIFVCALSWIAMAYGIIAHFISAIAMPIVSLGLDAATSLFTFVGAVVLSAMLTAVNCADFGERSPDYIAFGSDNDQKRCRQIQASAVFLWFLFATFVATLFFVFKEFRQGGGSIRSGPNMSQIGV
jgi:hypothetical protein